MNGGNKESNTSTVIVGKGSLVNPFARSLLNLRDILTTFPRPGSLKVFRLGRY